MNTDKTRPWGEWLRQRREELGISLEQAEAETRIRRRYLESLEAGDMAGLPGDVVGRGFLRNYASYLDLDPQEAARRFSEIGASLEPQVVSVDDSSPFVSGSFRPLALHQMPSLRARRGWLVGLLLIVVVAILAVLVWQGYPYVAGWLEDRGSVTRPTPTQRATSAVLSTATNTPTRATTATATDAGTPAGTPTLELTYTPTPTWTASPLPSPSAPVYTGIFLELVFTDTSWIQITVDGVRQFQGELTKDTYRSWYGEERIELRVGNAGAVLVTVNGELLGTLGGVGEVLDRIFEKVDDQVILNTPTPEISGTVTVEPTAPPTPVPTSAPTATPAAQGLIATPALTPTATLTPTQTALPTTTP